MPPGVRVRGLTSAPATATIDIAADSIEPNIISVTPAAGTAFLNKDKYTIEAIVSDGETGVQTVTFLVGGDPYRGLAERGADDRYV